MNRNLLIILLLLVASVCCCQCLPSGNMIEGLPYSSAEPYVPPVPPGPTPDPHGEVVATYTVGGQDVAVRYNDGWLKVVSSFTAEPTPWENDADLITGAEFTDQVRTIPSYSFCYSPDTHTGVEYPNLETVVFSENVQQIEHEAFAGQAALKTVNMSGIEGSIQIGYQAFDLCQISSLTFHLGGSTRIGSSAFSNASITSLIIPDNAYVDNNAFAHCVNLQTVVIGTNVVFNSSSTGVSNIFYECPSLVSIIFQGYVSLAGDGFVELATIDPSSGKPWPHVIQLEFFDVPPNIVVVSGRPEARPFNDTHLTVIYHSQQAQSWEARRGGTPEQDPFNKVFWGTDDLVAVVKGS